MRKGIQDKQNAGTSCRAAQKAIITSSECSEECTKRKKFEALEMKPYGSRQRGRLCLSGQNDGACWDASSLVLAAERRRRRSLDGHSVVQGIELDAGKEGKGATKIDTIRC